MSVYCSDTTPPPKEVPQSEEAPINPTIWDSEDPEFVAEYLRMCEEAAKAEIEKREPCKDADLPAVACGGSYP